MKHESSHISDIHWCHGRCLVQQDDSIECSLQMGGGHLQALLGPCSDGTTISWRVPFTSLKKKSQNGCGKLPSWKLLINVSFSKVSFLNYTFPQFETIILVSKIVDVSKYNYLNFMVI